MNNCQEARQYQDVALLFFKIHSVHYKLFGNSVRVIVYAKRANNMKTFLWLAEIHGLAKHSVYASGQVTCIHSCLGNLGATFKYYNLKAFP